MSLTLDQLAELGVDPTDASQVFHANQLIQHPLEPAATDPDDEPGYLTVGEIRRLMSALARVEEALPKLEAFAELGAAMSANGGGLGGLMKTLAGR